MGPWKIEDIVIARNNVRLRAQTEIVHFSRPKDKVLAKYDINSFPKEIRD